MAIGPFSTYAPPGVYVSTTVAPIIGQLLGGLRIPVLIGVAKETLSQSNYELVRGSSSFADTPIFGEDVASRWVSGGTPSNPLLGNQDGSKTQFRVRNYPIVDGQGHGVITYDATKMSVSVNGQQTVVSAVDGLNGLVSLLVPPGPDDVVTVDYYFHRKDTRITDVLTAQITLGSAILVAPQIETYTVVTGSNDLLIVTVDDGAASSTITLTAGTRTAADVANNINAAAIPGLTASVHTDAQGLFHVQLIARGNILLGSGSANGLLGFNPGTYTNRNKAFRVFQGPIVDGSDGGITTTDPSKVTVLVDGQQVLAKTVDGANRLVTLAAAPRDGQTITIAYWFNTFQDTFDYLPNSNIVNMGNVGIAPNRRDYASGADYVVVNDNDVSRIQWGSSFQVQPGIKTGAVALDSTQIVGTLIDNRWFGAECARFSDPVTSSVSTTKFVLPLPPTTGNGRDTPLGISLYQTITNSRIDLATNRPDLVTVYVGKSWRDAVLHPPVTVLEVDSSTNTFTLRDPVPADYKAFATFWYNRLSDDAFTVTVTAPGQSGVGQYTITSMNLGGNLFGAKFGVKGGLSKTIQWPSGVENIPDAIHSGAGTAVSETVTVTFSNALDPASHASFSNAEQEPYDLYTYSRLFGGVVIDGNPAFSVDLSMPYQACVVGSAITEPFTMLASDRLVLVIDGITIAPIDVSAATTLANVATAINSAVHLDTQAHPDGTGTFASTLGYNPASVLTYGTQSILVLESRYAGTHAYGGGTDGRLASVQVLIPTTAGQTDASGKVGLIPSTLSTGSYNALDQVAQLIGTADAPYNVTAGVNDSLQITVDGSDVTATLPSGTAVLLNNVVTAINDAYIAFASPADVLQYTTDVLALATQLTTKYNTHRVSTVFHVTGDVVTVPAGALVTLADAITRLNLIKTAYNAHLSQVGVHELNDTVDLVTVDDATNLQTAVHLANAIKSAYNAHLIAVGVHGHDDTTNTLASLVPAAVADDCLAILNDVKTKYNLHRVASGSHLIGDSVNIVTAPDDTDSIGGPYTTGFVLANNIKLKLNAHLIASGIHVVNDVTNTITSPDATDAASLILLTNELQAKYNTHRTQLEGIFHVHGTDDTTNGATASMTELVAHTGVGYYANQLVLTSRVNTVVSSLVIKSSGTANGVLGFSPVTVQRTQPTAANIAAALNVNISFYPYAVAYRVQAAGIGGFLRIDSLTTGSTSTISFTNVANSAFIPDAGLGITPGVSGDIGENAQSGFSVMSSAGSLGSHGTGFPGQTYSDTTTGLTFTVLPATSGDYDNGGYFTLTVGQTFTADAAVAVRAIPGLEMLVYNTYNTNIGTTAIVNTYGRSGAEPAVGDVYYVSYDYAKTDLSTQLYRDSGKIIQAFGQATPENPLSLAARIAQLNGAVLVGLKQVFRGQGQSQATAGAYTAAIDEQRKPIAGTTQPDVICTLSTDPTVFSFLNQHCVFMSTARQEGERTGTIGVAAGTSPLGVQAIAKGLHSELITAVYPDMFVVTVQDAQGNLIDQLVDGTYGAAALAGSVCNPAHDVAAPQTHRQIFGFKQLGRILDPTEANQVAVAGVTVFDQTGGGMRIRHALTTNIDTVVTRTPSVTLTIQYVQQIIRRALDPFIGQKLTGELIKSVENAMVGVFGQLFDQQIVSSVQGIDVNVDDVDPTILRASAIYVPVFPLEYISVLLQVRIRA
jgi:hypothetical protein